MWDSFALGSINLYFPRSSPPCPARLHGELQLSCEAQLLLASPHLFHAARNRQDRMCDCQQKLNNPPASPRWRVDRGDVRKRSHLIDRCKSNDFLSEQTGVVEVLELREMSSIISIGTGLPHSHRPYSALSNSPRLAINLFPVPVTCMPQQHILCQLRIHHQSYNLAFAHMPLWTEFLSSPGRSGSYPKAALIEIT